MAKKKLPKYIKVGDKVTTLLKSDAQRLLQFLYMTDYQLTDTTREALSLIALLRARDQSLRIGEAHDT